MKKTISIFAVCLGSLFFQNVALSDGPTGSVPADKESGSAVSSGSSLSLDDYLEQVAKSNPGYKSSTLMQQGAEEQSAEGVLTYSPQFFSNAQYADDRRLTPNSALYGRQTQLTSFSLGMSQTSSFGLGTKIYYNFNNSQVFGINPMILALASSFPMTAFTQTGLNLEFTLSLWRNSFGSNTRAAAAGKEAVAMTNSLNSAFQRKMTLSDAETRYWRLAIAQESVQVQQAGLDRALLIREHQNKRVTLNLAEKADLLQSEAGVKSREVDLKSGLLEEMAAKRAFNAARNIDSDEVKEHLRLMEPEEIEKLAVPERMLKREDVLAAEHAMKAAQANYSQAKEQQLPVAEIFANVYTSGFSGAVDTAVALSFSSQYPYMAGGVRLSMPLDFGSSSQVRSGYMKAIEAADLDYQRKQFDQEMNWKNLVQQFDLLKGKLQLAFRHQEVQRAKLELERERLKQGQSTTYQVYLFENDYLYAQLERIQTQGQILVLFAQMRTYRGGQ